MKCEVAAFLQGKVQVQDQGFRLGAVREELVHRGRKQLADAPPPFRSEVRFLRARVEWKAGRLAEAKKEFLEIAKGSARTGTATKSRAG